ncbi:hypothetical protein B7P43_G05860 [Cryptotermes secundus]|uniref:Endonuclease/exonuclease/phosphatase domain-containing protein n=1 Tax=Cryptotermes secundus TaxID=105785 RepID=A0A2J7R1E1_9NEOP|nr:hypothetical protein B7P43_G05860 [Cryptotermes secundus]
MNTKPRTWNHSLDKRPKLKNTDLRFGTWNVRSMYKAGSLRALAELSYIILKGRWCDIIVMNVHAPTEDKFDDIKDRFCKELEHVFDKFPKYPMKILLGDFNTKVRWEDIFKPAIGNESLLEISNDNGVRAVNFATSKYLTVKSTMFPHLNIHNFTWASPDGKIHNQIDNILIDRRRHSSILDVRSFRAADCDTDHYLVVAKVTERLVVSKQTTHRVHMERFNLKKLNEVDVKERYCVEISNRFAALENLDTEVDVNEAWESIRENIKMSAKESLGYYELKKHKSRFDEGCTKLLDQRKQAKLQWLQDPSELNGYNLNMKPDIEVETAIAKPKRYKSPGSDQIPAELIQAGGEILHSKIHNLITSIWHKEKLSDQWKESIIVPVHKKGDKTDCSNYRGISLLSTLYKIISQS